MNIKAKLSVQFTLIVVLVLLFFSALVYYFSFTSQNSKFRENLLEKAQNTAILLINVTEVDSTLLKKIHQSTTSWEKEEIAVTDSALNVIYSNNVRYLSERVIRQNSYYGELRYFSLAEKDGVCIKHRFNSKTYNVYVMAFDKSRMENLKELRNILLWSNIFSIWLSVLFAYFFSQRAIKPISRIIKGVRDINFSKLNSRLDEGNMKDEIAQLAITFNEMITDLEIAFKNQQDFVSNASHELRTPLTVMIGESDYLLSHIRTNEEYINHISGLIADLKKLNTLLNSLLELAQINRDKNLVFNKVRIDEIVFNAVFQIKNNYPGRKIVPKIHYPENEDMLLIDGVEGLLSIAFRNLIDNACKFSSDDVIIEFGISEDQVRIEISDKGVGIPYGEIGNIKMPFNRASNVTYIGGFGIGLSLVTRILELHNADYQIESKENEGTSVRVIFKPSGC